MSVSGILSSSFSNNLVGSSLAPSQLAKTQFQQLGQDLASGNLSAAQSDLAALQQAFAQPASVSSSSSSNPVAQAFQPLSTDLKSGNLSAAQKDYATIQQDLQGSSNARHLHHHHLPRSGSGFDPSPFLQDPSQLGQVLSSASSPSSILAAQQAYATEQQAGITAPPQSAGPNIVGLHHTEPPIYRPPVSFVV